MSRFRIALAPVICLLSAAALDAPPLAAGELFKSCCPKPAASCPPPKVHVTVCMPPGYAPPQHGHGKHYQTQAIPQFFAAQSPTLLMGSSFGVASMATMPVAQAAVAPTAFVPTALTTTAFAPTSLMATQGVGVQAFNTQQTVDTATLAALVQALQRASAASAPPPQPEAAAAAAAESKQEIAELQARVNDLENRLRAIRHCLDANLPR